jgi:DNA-binding SARP family transcriptional activator
MPLLVLAYLALQGKTQRGHLADLLWINLEEPKRRAVNLNEAIHRLRKLSPGVIEGDDWLETTATTDVQVFKKALEQGDIDRALEHYQGHFLDGLERNPRLSLGEEISEWIINTREALYGDFFELRLKLAEREAFREKYHEAADLAWQTYAHSTNITYPSAMTYQKLHTVLLAAERLDEAERVLKEANELYGQGSFFICEHPAEARARLSHSYTFRTENPLLVDREKDIEILLMTFEQHRLVSLIGPPGIGKTEVAQAVAYAARGQPFARDGVHIVWLEALSAESLQANVIALLAQALGVKAKTLQDLASTIGDSHHLLVLDNFEQLSKRHGSLIAELHQFCPNLRMLVTSRELLRLEYETPYLLSYLNRPKESSDVTLEEAHDYSSIALFEGAAKSQGFKLTQDNLPGVIHICQLVEGLPLGIKLAASWAGSLSPSDIATKISHELDLLNQTQGITRHDSIQATFESSLQLLSIEERLAVMKLAVFQGEFALDAVEQIASVNLRMLRLLIEKSLVRYDQDTQRYSFHALIGQYVRDVLAQHPEVSLEVRTAHANYYLGKLKRLRRIKTKPYFSDPVVRSNKGSKSLCPVKA